MAKQKIKVIIKRPEEEYGHIAYIFNTLESLQAKVGGHIEVFRLTSKVVIICNEEGKQKDMEPNLKIAGETLVGPIIVAGIDGENFGSIPFSYETWAQTVELNQWGITE